MRALGFVAVIAAACVGDHATRSLQLAEEGSGSGSGSGIEDCAWCPEDCGTCAPACGDGACSGDEDCATCPADCGACPPSCEGEPEDCFNVLQVFDDDPATRPVPSCTDFASWIAGEPFDPTKLSLGDEHLESADLPWLDVTPLEIHAALYDGTLVSFNRVAGDGHTLCSFVATWESPMKSTWIVETPPLSPIDDTATPDDPCDSGWQGRVAECQGEEAALLAASSLPVQDTSEAPVDPDYVIQIDPP